MVLLNKNKEHYDVNSDVYQSWSDKGRKLQEAPSHCSISQDQDATHTLEPDSVFQQQEELSEKRLVSKRNNQFICHIYFRILQKHQSRLKYFKSRKKMENFCQLNLEEFR